MVTFLTILHVFVCLFLILVVLLQAGKGGGMGIAFGGAGSQTVFGSSGAGNFLTRLTSVTAAIFLITSLGLAHYSSQQDSRRLQQLAERKAADKKSEDERAAKLKTELEKARATIEQTAGAAGAAGATGVATTPALNLAPAAPAAKTEAPAAKTAAPAAKTEAPAAKTEAPAAPPVKRKVKAKPAAEGAAAPAEGKPAEAPAAPTEPTK
jgi:preprotein translocase subunit SecG